MKNKPSKILKIDFNEKAIKNETKSLLFLIIERHGGIQHLKSVQYGNVGGLDIFLAYFENEELAAKALSQIENLGIFVKFWPHNTIQ